ncbi:hypothetical protein M758_2G202100 [Ceratodon purpureus]|nr:hypothetical protein M758_2G202100 [Ceratodon purpureus]
MEFRWCLCAMGLVAWWLSRLSLVQRIVFHKTEKLKTSCKTFGASVSIQLPIMDQSWPNTFIMLGEGGRVPCWRIWKC